MNIFFVGVLLLVLSGIFTLLVSKKYKVFSVAIFTTIATVLCLIPALSCILGSQTFLFGFELIYWGMA